MTMGGVFPQVTWRHDKQLPSGLPSILTAAQVDTSISAFANTFVMMHGSCSPAGWAYNRLPFFKVVKR
jgi:hypothetical protein